MLTMKNMSGQQSEPVSSGQCTNVRNKFDFFVHVFVFISKWFFYVFLELDCVVNNKIEINTNIVFSVHFESELAVIKLGLFGLWANEGKNKMHTENTIHGQSNMYKKKWWSYFHLFLCVLNAVLSLFWSTNKMRNWKFEIVKKSESWREFSNGRVFYSFIKLCRISLVSVYG